MHSFHRIDRSQLTRLPLRGLVALTARNAKRLQPLLTLWAIDSNDLRWIVSVDKAIGVALCFASGDSSPAEKAYKAIGNPLLDDGIAEAVELVTTTLFSDDRPNQTGAMDAVFEARAAYEAASRAYGFLATNNPTELEWLLEYAESPRQTESTVTDYHALLSMRLGAFPELGKPVDVSESGPLGSLWTTPPFSDIIDAVRQTETFLATMNPN